MRRRGFLKTAAAAGAAGAAGCGQGDSGGGSGQAVSGKTFRWQMATTWSKTLPVLGEGADLLAKWIDEMSGGRLKIEVHGGGELIPEMQVFDNVRQGTVDMGHGAAYYWKGQVPAAQFFASVPFGFNAQQMNAWLLGGGGMKLWEELYAGYGVVPLPVGNTGVQMGGWFNKKIAALGDLEGLTMRIPGLGGEVLDAAGGSPQTTPGAEIYTNLERGVIDATEWVGPYHDYKMGFHKIAKYYYYPGWHEPGTTLELCINKAKWDALPKDLQEIVRAAAHRSNAWMLSEFEARNGEYLEKIRSESKVEILPFPSEVLAGLRKLTDETLAGLTSENAEAKKVYDHFQAFRKRAGDWSKLTEESYYSLIRG